MEQCKGYSGIKPKDILFLPLRLLFNHETVNRLGLTSLLDERVNVCSKYAKAPVLDIGCGEENMFIRKTKSGFGLDILSFKNIDVCADVGKLPFKDKCFQTVSFIGSINYMPDVNRAFSEARRVLKPQGSLLVTTTAVFWSKLRHKTAWWNKPHNRITGDMPYGYDESDLKQILNENGFTINLKATYFLGISSILIASYE